MNYSMTIFLATFLLLVSPFSLRAASPEHGGMMMGGMIMLEEKTEDGVRGMVHLSDVGEAMAKMGMQENMHFMVMFSDTSTGAPVSEGTAALKVTDPSGKESEAMALMLMDGMFGVDLALKEKGAYRFTVGTKLADGKKRQFEFEYMLK